MNLPHTPIAFNGQINNCQFVFSGGNPTMHNHPQPLASPISARPKSRSSYADSPSALNSLEASSVAQGHSSSAPQGQHAQAGPPATFSSPHLELCSPLASLLSALGSPMNNLNGLQARTSITPGPGQFNDTEERIHQHTSPVVCVHPRTGYLHPYEHERVDNNLPGCTATMYRSSQHIPFLMPHSPTYSSPVPSSNLNVHSVSGPDRCDWCIDERDDSDDDDDYH